MVDRIRNKRKRKKIRTRIIFFGTLFLFFGSIILNNIYSRLVLNKSIILSEPVIFEEKESLNGIIIKDEHLYLADADGNVELFYKEGDRIPAGYKVVILNINTDKSNLNSRLTEVNNRISSFEKINRDIDIKDIDENKIQDELEAEILTLQNNIFNGHYGNIDDNIQDLTIKHSKRNILSGKNTLIHKTLINLNNERDNILEQLSKSMVDVYSEEAGIVSYKIDGYENIYTFNSVEDYGYEDFSNNNIDPIKISRESPIKAGQAIFKIINNLEWYIIMKFDTIDFVQDLNIGRNINVYIEDTEEYLNGKVKCVNIENNKGLLTLRFNTNFDNYFNKRFIDLNLIKSKFSCFKIPKVAITENDGIQGVYIKDVSGIVRFRPIDIIHIEDDSIFVNADNSEINTVTAYDEVLLNPDKLKEGDLID